MAVLDIDEILQSYRQESQQIFWPDIVALLTRKLEQEGSVTVRGTGDEQFAALGKAFQECAFPQLQTLRLHWKRLSVAGLVELSSAILAGNLQELRVLVLANSFQRAKYDFGFGDSGLIALTTALGSGHSSSLKALQIGDFQKSLHDEIFGSEGARALAQLFLLGGLPVLEDLRLNGLHTEEGVVAIMSGLEAGIVGSFKRLRLENCEIGLEGALAVASALQYPNFSALETLNLQDNVGRALGDDGIMILSTAFRSPSMNNLQILWLHNVSMGERGLMELASVLQDGYLPSLRKLYVAGAQHSLATTEAFELAYRNNSSLVACIFLRRPTNAKELGDSDTEGAEEYETEEMEDLKYFEAQLEYLRVINEKLVKKMKRII
ncbi:hypothetical protein Mapa_017576 [Marchantia paleacea]|nr:hypothetical protein Mapa_017576 [Marchantia paleacea]